MEIYYIYTYLIIILRRNDTICTNSVFFLTLYIYDSITNFHTYDKFIGFDNNHLKIHNNDYLH